MTLGEFMLPVVVAMIVAAAAAGLHRHASPTIAARALLSTTAILGLATVGIAASWTAVFIAHRPAVLDVAGWCRHVVGSHTTVPGWLGAAATALLVVGTIRAFRVMRAWRSFHRTIGRSVEVVCSDQHFAYTLPGPGRQIVVSSALVCSLEPEQVDVVLAHERAHGRHRHDRFVLVGHLAVAFAPWLVPLQRRLEFALERWADDVAAASTGGNRALVAETVARVALSQAAVPAGALAFGGLGINDRVEVLLRPPVVGRVPVRVVMMAATVIVAAAVVMQFHHVGTWLLALCSA